METTAVKMLVARNNGVSAASMQRRRWPAPQRKMNRANKISSTTTLVVARLVTLGNLHNPITICTGMEKYAQLWLSREQRSSSWPVLLSSAMKNPTKIGPMDSLYAFLCFMQSAHRLFVLHCLVLFCVACCLLL